MIRDLNDKGLGQNKVLYSSSGVELPWSTTMQATRQRSSRHRDRSPATRRLLALEPHLLGFFFVASLLLPLPCCLFLVASSLSPHLAHFLARPVGRPRFCFAGSWIVGLAMGGAESRGADVAVGFSGWSL